MKKIKIIITTFILLCLFAPINTFAVVDSSNADLDPAVGTASADKERAIAAGKQLIGKVNYLMINHSRTNLEMITYDYANDSSSTKGLGIDCSEFVSLVFSKGYGVQWGSDSTNPTNTNGFVNSSNTPKKFLLTINSYSEAKRGDIILTNDYGHVVIYLGDGWILGSNGSNSTSKTAGPSIKKAEYFSIAQGTYNVIRLPDNSEDALKEDIGILQKGHKDTSIKIDGSTNSDSESSTDSKETTETQSKYFGADAWKNKIVNFQNNAYQSTFNGIQLGSTGFINNALVLGLNNMSTRTIKYAYVIMMYITTALILYMFLSIIIYLVILPNGLGGEKVSSIFKIGTGLDPYGERKFVIMSLLGRLSLSLILITCLYANLIPVAISGVINIFKFFIGIF